MRGCNACNTTDNVTQWKIFTENYILKQVNKIVVLEGEETQQIIHEKPLQPHESRFALWTGTEILENAVFAIDFLT